MKKLDKLSCSACRGDELGLNASEIETYLKELPDWKLVEVDDIPQLKREFSFKNFADAMAFANELGLRSDADNHHPAILVEWGRVSVSWWTHNINALHLNDFIMAAKTNEIYKNIE